MKLVKLPSAKEICVCDIRCILQVECYGFRLADVFHGFGNRNPGLFANVEKAVNRRAGSEDDGRMSQYFNALASEFLERYPYYADERHIFDFSLVFLG